jgi:hypothetical protein
MDTDPEDAPRPDGSVAIYLTADEALVLDAFLARPDLAIEDQAEQRVLWDLGAVLETRVPVVNNADYERMLAAARDRLRDSVESH